MSEGESRYVDLAHTSDEVAFEKREGSNLFIYADVSGIVHIGIFSNTCYSFSQSSHRVLSEEAILCFQVFLFRLPPSLLFIAEEVNLLMLVDQNFFACGEFWQVQPRI